MAAAIVSIQTETERCSGCGIHPDDAGHIRATIEHCPTCHDVDATSRQLHNMAGQGKPPPAGQRVHWRTVEPGQASSMERHGPAGKLEMPAAVIAQAERAKAAELASRP